MGLAHLQDEFSVKRRARKRQSSRGTSGWGGGQGQVPQVCSLRAELDFHLRISRLKINFLNSAAAPWGRNVCDAAERRCLALTQGGGAGKSRTRGQGPGASETVGPGAPFRAGLSHTHPGHTTSLAGGLHTQTCRLFFVQVNFILFVSIIRILMQKLTSPDVGGNDQSQYK